MTTATVATVIGVLQRTYPPDIAETWDTGIGLTCGDPDEVVRSVLLAVDVDAQTVRQAVDIGAQLLVTHHPLLFRPVQSVAANTPKGALIHRLVTAGVAHFAAHTNADKATGGVNDALADTLGLIDIAPLDADPATGLDKIVVFTPVAEQEAMIRALSAAGAGIIGDYSDAAFSTTGIGQFRPLPAATPTIGEIGRLETVAESRIEMVLPRSARSRVVAALRAAHSYSEPAFDVVELAAPGPGRTGSGRVGRLVEPLTLREFTRLVAERLPGTVAGVRAAGDPDRRVSSVAVCGGAGSSLLGAAADVGADVFLTSDLSHHEVAEYVDDQDRPAVVEVAHWAGEWPFLARAAQVIEDALAGSVTVVVSRLRTDPWTVHCPSTERSG